MNQTPAASQLPLCGSTMTSPRPAVAGLLAGAPGRRTSVSATIRSLLSVGSRKASCQ